MAAIPPGADLSKIPLAPNPNRDPPNFVNPPNQAVVVLAVGVPLVAISSCFVSLRIFTNYRVAHKLGLDDCMWKHQDSQISLVPTADRIPPQIFAFSRKS